MRSSAPREEASEALEASNYDIVDSNEAAFDLVSETESLASTDCTPSDASVLSDNDDDEYHRVDRDLQAGLSSVYIPTDPEFNETEEPAHIDDSTHTESPSHKEDHEMHGRMPITFEEHIAEEPGHLLGTHVVKVYQAQASDWSHVFDQYDCAEVRLTVKAGLSEDCIAPPDTYKIWYIGDCEKYLANDISLHIAAALNASPSASRSIMVQGQLEPYGPVMSTHRCTKIKMNGENACLSNVTLTFEGNQEVTLGPRKALARGDRPDLLVVCHPTQASSEEIQELNSVADFLRRERVPLLELIAARPYGKGITEYDSNSLVACVEGRNDPKKGYELKEVIPLDLFNFFEIDPVQLNRHLAFISPHLVGRRTSQSEHSVNSSTSDSWRDCILDVARHPRIIGYIISILVLILAAPTFMGMMQEMSTRANFGIMDPAANHSNYSSSLLTVTAPSHTIILPATVSAVKAPPNGLTLVPDQPKKPKNKCKKYGKCGKWQVEEFRIGSAEDHRFILLPSKALRDPRKKPHLQIQVSRKTESVPIRFNRTIDGTYIVDLERQFSYSSFNVSIATFSKPLLRQSFEVMLGHNKSVASELLDKAMLGYLSAQITVLETREHLLAIMQEAGLKANDWIKDRAGDSRRSDDAKMDILCIIGKRIEAGSDLLRKLPGTAWTGVREATAPIRTSQSMLNARNNALRARCNLETAAGLSSSRPDGEKSWACSKVQV